MKKVGEEILYDNKKQEILAIEKEGNREVYLIKDEINNIDVIDNESLKEEIRNEKRT